MKKNANGPRRDKSDLPQKACVACGIPFQWRRKWARNWEQMRYCSNRCANKRKPSRAT